MIPPVNFIWQNTQILQALKALVTLNENLKNQENAFKANCKRQLADLEEQIAQLKQQMFFFVFFSLFQTKLMIFFFFL